MRRGNEGDPNIDWEKSTMLFERCPEECGVISSLNDLKGDQDKNVSTEQAFHLADRERLFAYDVDAWVASWVATSDYGKEKKLSEREIFNKNVPRCYHEYTDIFEKKDFNKLPER